MMVLRRLDFSNLLMSLSGGMAALDTTAKRWEELTKSVIWQAYGLTETSPLVSVPNYKQTEFTGSVGCLLHSLRFKFEMKIIMY